MFFKKNICPPDNPIAALKVLYPRSDFTVDPEEARAKAASRKASRMASRERGEPEEVKVEELGEL